MCVDVKVHTTGCNSGWQAVVAAGNVLLCQSTEDLGVLAKDTGQSAYRGKQLYDGMMHGARKLDDINNVSPKFV